MNGQEPDLVQRDFDRYDRACEQEGAFSDAVEAKREELLEYFYRGALGKALNEACCYNDTGFQDLALGLESYVSDYFEELAHDEVKREWEDNANAAADCAEWQQEQDRRDRYDY